MTRNERWILSEWRVACDRVRRFGERLRYHRERTPYAEVDLLFESLHFYTLIEVKTWTPEAWEGPLLSRRQEQRLRAARIYFEQRLKAHVEILVATVGHNGEIDYHDLLDTRLGPGA